PRQSSARPAPDAVSPDAAGHKPAPLPAPPARLQRLVLAERRLSPWPRLPPAATDSSCRGIRPAPPASALPASRSLPWSVSQLNALAAEAPGALGRDLLARKRFFQIEVLRRDLRDHVLGSAQLRAQPLLTGFRL